MYQCTNYYESIGLKMKLDKQQNNRNIQNMLRNYIYFLSAIVFFGFYCVFIEPNMLTLNHYTIQNEQLQNIKIVFVSDFHVSSSDKKRLDKIIQKINAEKPDIVLSVGDYVNGHKHDSTMPIEDIAKSLAQIKSKYGFYTTLGNHDGWYGNDRIKQAFEQNGITVLANGNTGVNISDKMIYIAGVEDLGTGKPDIKKAVNNTLSPVILLTHNPDIFPDVPDFVTLTLAGHTHGGQIRIPFFGPIKTYSKYGAKYAYGYIAENNKQMIVTKGIGTSILPIRFNCMPEIVIIDFK